MTVEAIGGSGVEVLAGDEVPHPGGYPGTVAFDGEPLHVREGPTPERPGQGGLPEASTPDTDRGDHRGP
jgi:hypothetical protein